MLANPIMDLLYRIMPAQYWYYFVTGMAVVAAAGAVWVWLRRKDGG